MAIHTIDAAGKKLGRVASEAAKVLMGKDSTDFSRNTVRNVRVEIVNAGKVEISAQKKQEKQYKSFSGYAGGLNLTSLDRMLEKRGIREVFRKAVYGMLPSNKLRSKMIKNLSVKE